jgi:hypothetical protein
MPLLSGTRGGLIELAIDVPELDVKELPLFSESAFQKTAQSPLKEANFPAREKHTVAFCRAYVDSYCPGCKISESDLERVEALLLQVAALNICSLQDRACTENLVGDKAIESQDHEFLHTFCTATQGLMEMSTELDKQDGWHLFDIVDGRVFFQFLKKIRSNGWVAPEILAYAKVLHKEAVRG